MTFQREIRRAMKAFGIVALAAITIANQGCICTRPIQPNEPEIEARAKISANRESVESLVPRIKQQFDQDSPEYITARRLYDEAKTQNNSWLSTLKLAIQNNEDLGNSEQFRKLSDNADKATELFVKNGNQILMPSKRALTPSKIDPDKWLSREFNIERSSMILGMGVGEVAQGLSTLGVALWKELKEEKSKERNLQAERTEKELKWKSWEDVKQN
jgi:hypothetical protein